MKIAVLDGYTLNPGDLDWNGLNALGDVKIFDRTAPDAVLQNIGDAEAVITNKVVIDRAVLDAKPNIRYVGVLATGYNVVDVAATKEKGVVVTNVPDYSTDSVAQTAIALLLEHCQQVGHHARTIREGRWTHCADFSYHDTPLIELRGKTMGIVGYGYIGQAVAAIAAAFGMKVLVYNRTREKVKETGAIAYADMKDVFAKSDFVSLHIPMTTETQDLVNAEMIATMKDGAVIINTARGGLVNEADVAAALDSGKLAGFCADVVSQEPIKADNPLLKAKNCILTPHFAWATGEARRRLMDVAVNNLRAFIAGKPENVVGK
ncbi:MAG: D-2-hydroxyacid dehydrogenase [Planctomycetaceae bacterium]|nr:D-2-hydroxyacid dehydrogenase [Planctomycetaceae bacterium]